MKDNIKKLLTVALLGFSLLSSKADSSYSLTLTNAVTNILSIAGWQISQIIVTAPTTNTALVSFYDSASGNVYTNAAWVSRTTVSTNISTVFTNTVGLVQTNIYPGIFTSLTTNAASTNLLPVVASFAVPQAAAQTRDTSIVTVKGLVAVPNTNGINITILYNPTVNQ